MSSFDSVFEETMEGEESKIVNLMDEEEEVEDSKTMLDMFNEELEEDEPKEETMRDIVTARMKEIFDIKPTLIDKRLKYPTSTTFKNNTFKIEFVYHKKKIVENIKVSELKKYPDFLNDHFIFKKELYEKSVKCKENKSRMSFVFFDFSEYRNNLIEIVLRRIEENHKAPWDTFLPSAVMKIYSK